MSSRRRFVTTGPVRDGGRPAPDVVERTGSADRLWVADITYIPTSGQAFSIAVVLDDSCCILSRWSMYIVSIYRRMSAAADQSSPCNAPRNWLTSSSDGVQFGSLGLTAGGPASAHRLHNSVGGVLLAPNGARVGCAQAVGNCCWVRVLRNRVSLYGPSGPK